jgi:hypothetical protein
MSRTPSYRLIDYYLRPGKNVERKMILEGIKNIAKKQHIDYSYIGMGSLAFIDFRIFHKELMIKDMISIEKKVGDKDRFEFNRPLKIEIKYNDTTSVLPKLGIKNKDAVLWLDYDGNFSRSMVNDFTYIFSTIKPFSIVLFTCRQDLDIYLDYDNDGAIISFSRFSDEFEEFSPSNITNNNFEMDNFPKTIRQTIVNAIETALSNRSPNSTSKERLKFKQLFFFTYSDGAPMLTFGGIVLDDSVSESFDKEFQIERMDFVREKDEPYEINIPILTKKETDFLNKFLPDDSMQEFIKHTNLHKIPEPERKAYYSLYRFLPDFRETSY